MDHNTEWGRPVGDDVRLFEMLMLEAFQAGLSWLTILRKRENFRKAFRNFDPPLIGRFGARDVARLMADEGIVRNRAKIAATINNARRLRDVSKEFGSFAAYVWSYEPKRQRRPASPDDLVSQSAEAVAMSSDLRKRGWVFVGPTTIYSFMQATGLVNDHIRGCAAGAEAERLRQEFIRPERGWLKA